MEFMDPPLYAKRQYWPDTVKKLQANPMQWGRTGPFAVGAITSIRTGKYVAFLPKDLAAIRPVDYIARLAYMKEHWELISQKIEEKDRFHVFIRWIGPAEQSRDAGELTDEEPTA